MKGRNVLKQEERTHRTATTSYPCCVSALGEFRGSWSCAAQGANIKGFLSSDKLYLEKRGFDDIQFTFLPLV